MKTLIRPRPGGLRMGVAVAAGMVAILSQGPAATAQSDRANAVTLEPFQAEGSVSAPAQSSAALEPPIPDGKQLVVEAVFGMVQVAPAGQRTLLFLGPADRSGVPIPLIHAGGAGGADIYLPSPSPTRLYLPAGPINIAVLPLGASAVAAGITVVGHLISAP
jgi:hypothetical protein